MSASAGDGAPDLPAWAVVSPRRAGHIGRVAALLAQWAAARGVAAQEEARWRRAALLHDALRDATAVAAAARAVLDAERALAVDYVACIDPATFTAAADADDATVLALAARVGATRLIDNVVLGEGLEGDVRLGG